MLKRELILVLALVGFAPRPARAQAQETYVLWGDAQKGRQIYAEAGCAQCHAINGVGGTLGPDLGAPPARHQTVTQMAGVMWNHAPEMRRAAEARGLTPRPLSGDEILDLLTYLYSLHFLDQAGNPRRGARLFVSKGCAACHAITGDRPAIGPPLGRLRQYASPILWAEAMWSHALEMQEKIAELGLEWPTFRDNEMVDLITYVRAAARPPKP
jgi:mono/diheme cytochrome c family protein